VYTHLKGAGGETYPVLSKIIKLSRTRTGVSNPHWRDQIKNHVNATTDLSGQFDLLIAEVGDMQNSKTDSEYSYRGDIAAYDTPTPLTDPVIGTEQATQRAMQRAYKQIHAAQTAMSGQVFLGELKEAVHTLRHPAEGLRKALKEHYLDKLKRIKNRDPKRWWKAISQTWLESSFGWRPFINDLEDAASAYNELCNKEALRYKKIRAVGKADPIYLPSLSAYGPVNYPSGSNSVEQRSRKVTDECICVIRGEVKAQAATTTMDKLRIFGLQPSEFIPTVWELLPWSFLVDYFTNIGDILENAVTDTSNVAWLEMSTIKKRVTDTLIVPDNSAMRSTQGSKYIYSRGNRSTCHAERRLVTRTGTVNLSIPPLMFELPGSSIKQLNMVALFTQATSELHPQKRFRSPRYRS
jgi:hypothetical protein